MIAAVAIEIRELLDAAVFGFGTAFAVSIGLLLLSIRQGAKVRKLATTTLSRDRLQAAICRAEDEKLDLLRDVLHSAAADVAADQGLDEEQVRVGLFNALEDRWSVSPTDPQDATSPTGAEWEEWGLGEAENRGKPIITVGAVTGEPDALTHWSIALPIPGAEEEPAWIMHIEGSGTDPGPTALHSSAALLLYYREVLELLLKATATASAPWSPNKKS